MWIHAVLEWREAAPGRYVRVYEEDSGRLVGVAAYRHIEEGQPGTGYFIYILAVSHLDRRSPAKYGTQIMLGLIHHFATKEPGNLLTFMVESSNRPCHSFCSSINAGEPSSPPEHPGFLEYTILLPEV